MPRTWPAIDIAAAADSDLALAAVDDFGPTALDQSGGGDLRIFFATAGGRDRARAALLAADYRATAVDIEDEDWAARSQESLTPITVGRLTVTPPWSAAQAASDHPDSIVVVIQPSMGFGTGQHATTRLCLRALQTLDLAGLFLMDVGTGSGVLAIAGVRLGAAQAIGIDNDPDAVQSALANLALNQTFMAVAFGVADLFASALPAANVITANLTGAVLSKAAGILAGRVAPGGTLIASGLLTEERADVLCAFEGHLKIVWEGAEDGWLAFAMQR